MRAVLILAVLMSWVYCVAGAVGLTVYLAAIAAAALRDRRRGVERSPPPPARGVVTALAVFATVMAACATAMAALVLWDRPSAPVGAAAAWSALPTWSALVAATTAVVLRRRGRNRPADLRPG